VGFVYTCVQQNVTDLMSSRRELHPGLRVGASDSCRCLALPVGGVFWLVPLHREH
jgi:hypothetical protein